MKEGNFGCSVAILRMQLDNVLIFNGILGTDDPHHVAYLIFNGEKIRNLEDKNGKKMYDSYLVKLMSKNNSWLKSAYDFASGYIHLSKEHMDDVLARSWSIDEGKMEFILASHSDHVDVNEKIRLIHMFSSITEGIFALQEKWFKAAKMYCLEDLMRKYPNS